MKALRLFLAFVCLVCLQNNTVFAQSGTPSDPIIINTLNTGSYSASGSTVERDSSYAGQPSGDVTFKFTLPVARWVYISLCGVYQFHVN